MHPRLVPVLLLITLPAYALADLALGRLGPETVVGFVLMHLGWCVLGIWPAVRLRRQSDQATAHALARTHAQLESIDLRLDPAGPCCDGVEGDELDAVFCAPDCPLTGDPVEDQPRAPGR